MSADACMAIEANFAWFSSRCLRPSVAEVTWDGETWPVCEEHRAAYLNEGAS